MRSTSAAVTDKPVRRSDFSRREAFAHSIGALLLKELGSGVLPSGFNIGMMRYKVSTGNKILIAISGNDKLASKSIQHKLINITNSKEFKEISNRYKELGEISLVTQSAGQTAKKYGYGQLRIYPNIQAQFGEFDKKALREEVIQQNTYFLIIKDPPEVRNSKGNKIEIEPNDLKKITHKVKRIKEWDEKDVSYMQLKKILYKIIRKDPAYEQDAPLYFCSEPVLAAEREKLVLLHDEFEDIDEIHFGFYYKNIINKKIQGDTIKSRPACNECCSRLIYKLKDSFSEGSNNFSPIEPLSGKKWKSIASFGRTGEDEKKVVYAPADHYIARAKEYLEQKPPRKEFAKICYGAAIAQMEKALSATGAGPITELAECYFQRACILHDIEHKTADQINIDDLQAAKDFARALQLNPNMTATKDKRMTSLQENAARCAEHAIQESEKLLKELEDQLQSTNLFIPSAPNDFEKIVIYLQLTGNNDAKDGLFGKKFSEQLVKKIESVQKKCFEYQVQIARNHIKNLPITEDYEIHTQIYQQAIHDLHFEKANFFATKEQLSELRGLKKELEELESKNKKRWHIKKAEEMYNVANEKEGPHTDAYIQAKWHLDQAKKYKEEKVGYSTDDIFELENIIKEAQEVTEKLNSLPNPSGPEEIATINKIIKFCFKIVDLDLCDHPRIIPILNHEHKESKITVRGKLAQLLLQYKNSSKLNNTDAQRGHCIEAAAKIYKSIALNEAEKDSRSEYEKDKNDLLIRLGSIDLSSIDEVYSSNISHTLETPPLTTTSTLTTTTTQNILAPSASISSQASLSIPVFSEVERKKLQGTVNEKYKPYGEDLKKVLIKIDVEASYANKGEAILIKTKSQKIGQIAMETEYKKATHFYTQSINYLEACIETFTGLEPTIRPLLAKHYAYRALSKLASNIGEAKQDWGKAISLEPEIYNTLISLKSWEDGYKLYNQFKTEFSQLNSLMASVKEEKIIGLSPSSTATTTSTTTNTRTTTPSSETHSSSSSGSSSSYSSSHSSSTLSSSLSPELSRLYETLIFLDLTNIEDQKTLHDQLSKFDMNTQRSVLLIHFDKISNKNKTNKKNQPKSKETLFLEKLILEKIIGEKKYSSNIKLTKDDIRLFLSSPITPSSTTSSTTSTLSTPPISQPMAEVDPIEVTGQQSVASEVKKGPPSSAPTEKKQVYLGELEGKPIEFTIDKIDGNDNNCAFKALGHGKGKPVERKDFAEVLLAYYKDEEARDILSEEILGCLAVENEMGYIGFLQGKYNSDFTQQEFKTLSNSIKLYEELKKAELDLEQERQRLIATLKSLGVEEIKSTPGDMKKTVNDLCKALEGVGEHSQALGFIKLFKKFEEQEKILNENLKSEKVYSAYVKAYTVDMLGYSLPAGYHAIKLYGKFSPDKHNVYIWTAKEKPEGEKQKIKCDLMPQKVNPSHEFLHIIHGNNFGHYDVLVETRAPSLHFSPTQGALGHTQGTPSTTTMTASTIDRSSFSDPTHSGGTPYSTSTQATSSAAPPTKKKKNKKKQKIHSHNQEDKNNRRPSTEGTTSWEEYQTTSKILDTQKETGQYAISEIENVITALSDKNSQCLLTVIPELLGSINDPKKIPKILKEQANIMNEFKKDMACMVSTGTGSDETGHFIIFVIVDKTLLVIDPYGHRGTLLEELNVIKKAAGLDKLVISSNKVQTDNISCGPISMEIALSIQKTSLEEVAQILASSEPKTEDGIDYALADITSLLPQGLKPCNSSTLAEMNKRFAAVKENTIIHPEGTPQRKLNNFASALKTAEEEKEEKKQLSDDGQAEEGDWQAIDDQLLKEEKTTYTLIVIPPSSSSQSSITSGDIGIQLQSDGSIFYYMESNNTSIKNKIEKSDLLKKLNNKDYEELCKILQESKGKQPALNRFLNSIIQLIQQDDLTSGTIKSAKNITATQTKTTTTTAPAKAKQKRKKKKKKVLPENKSEVFSPNRSPPVPATGEHPETAMATAVPSVPKNSSPKDTTFIMSSLGATTTPRPSLVATDLTTPSPNPCTLDSLYPMRSSIAAPLQAPPPSSSLVPKAKESGKGDENSPPATTRKPK